MTAVAREAALAYATSGGALSAQLKRPRAKSATAALRRLQPSDRQVEAGMTRTPYANFRAIGRPKSFSRCASMANRFDRSHWRRGARFGDSTVRTEPVSPLRRACWRVPRAPRFIIAREHQDLWGFMLPWAERPQQHYRWRDRDTIPRKESGACHRARGFGSAATGGPRASSTASADVCRSAC